MSVGIECVDSVVWQEVGAPWNESPAGGNSRIRNLGDLIRRISEQERNFLVETTKRECPKVPKSLVPSDANGSDDHHHEPKVMSFGPYHYGNPKLVRGEKIKLNLAAHFFEVVAQQNKSSVKAEVDGMFYPIRKRVGILKECYDTEWTLKNVDDDEFCAMMLVDGCALLCYILFVCIGGGLEDYDIRYEDLSRLHRDALLLENQLPYKPLLVLLMSRMLDLSTNQWKLKFRKFFGLIDEPFIQESSVIEEKAHIFLQKMKNSCCGRFLSIVQNSGRKENRDAGYRWIDELTVCHHLLHLYLLFLLGDGISSPKFVSLGLGSPTRGGLGSVDVVKEQVSTSFRNVKELMAAGIRIKRSTTRYLRDISFTSNGITACLTLPTITIDNSTKAMFFNLIAYEMSSSTPREFVSYLRFLDSLIDHADDVAELQSAGVLRNNLGTHEVVAEFFNTVSANLDSNCEAYENVRIQIRKHLVSNYNSKLKMWLTQCLHTYFGSPWTIIAWVGATLALFLTAVQTYFSAFSH